MRYRRAISDDAAALAQLRWQFRHEDPEPGGTAESRDDFAGRFATVVRESLAGGRWTIWVAEDEHGEVVANVWLYRVPRVPSPGHPTHDLGYVTNVYTRSGHRNREIGAALLDAVIGFAAEQAFEMLIVWPSERSVEFYARRGFVASREMMERTFGGELGT